MFNPGWKRNTKPLNVTVRKVRSSYAAHQKKLGDNYP
jgi:hypothetical protein